MFLILQILYWVMAKFSILIAYTSSTFNLPWIARNVPIKIRLHAIFGLNDPVLWGVAVELFHRLPQVPYEKCG